MTQWGTPLHSTKPIAGLRHLSVVRVFMGSRDPTNTRTIHKQRNPAIGFVLSREVLHCEFNTVRATIERDAELALLCSLK